MLKLRRMSTTPSTAGGLGDQRPVPDVAVEGDDAVRDGDLHLPRAAGA